MVAFEPSVEENKDYSELKKYCELHLVHKNLNNSVYSVVRSLFSGTPYNIQKYISQEMLKTINQLLQEEDFDIVHIDGLHMAYYGLEIKKFIEIPVVLREHNIESIIMRRVRENAKTFLLETLPLQYKKIYNYEKCVTDKLDKCAVITKER